MVKKRVKKPMNKSSGHSHTATRKSPSPWAAATVILVLVIVIWLASNAGFFSGDSSITLDDAEQLVLDFATAAQSAEVTFVSAEMKSGLYEVVISIEGQEVPVYVTTDGKYLVPSIIPYEEALQPAPAQ